MPPIIPVPYRVVNIARLVVNIARLRSWEVGKSGGQKARKFKGCRV